MSYLTHNRSIHPRLNIAVVCECSGTVRDAILAANHHAVSIDTQPSRTPGPHIQADARTLNLSIYDALICFPPCTYLTKANNRNWNNTKEVNEAVDFIKYLWDSNEHVSIENPPGQLRTLWKPPDQYIDPSYFGEERKKLTCLWLKGLPPLMFTVINPYAYHWVANHPDTKDRPYNRSKTTPGVAHAMANQWTKYLEEVLLCPNYGSNHITVNPI